MTLEEAIYCMKSYLPDNRVESCIRCKYYESCHSNEAHEMAIEALKAQKLSETRKALDTISRQAAINAIENTECELLPEEWDELTDAIMSVPSAQPETAKRIVGKSRDGMTLWYQCDMCNEPVDAQDNFCRGCGRRLADG